VVGINHFRERVFQAGDLGLITVHEEDIPWWHAQVIDEVLDSLEEERRFPRAPDPVEYHDRICPDISMDFQGVGVPGFPFLEFLARPPGIQRGEKFKECHHKIVYDYIRSLKLFLYGYTRHK